MKDRIAAEVLRLKKKYPGFSPEELASALGIHVLKKAMGAFSGACKGFFICLNRIPYITVNSELSHELQQIIICHELGHAVLHRDYPEMMALHDVALFDDTSRFEYEANLFAAEYLLSDSDVLETMMAGMPLSSAAASLGVPMELLDFKWRAMEKRGIAPAAPMMARGDFLRKF